MRVSESWGFEMFNVNKIKILKKKKMLETQSKQMIVINIFMNEPTTIWKSIFIY